jgi:hypothetical protein
MKEESAKRCEIIEGESLREGGDAIVGEIHLDEIMIFLNEVELSR